MPDVGHHSLASPAEKLPVEVTNEIFSYLSVGLVIRDGTPTELDDHRGARDQLLTLATVCRTWRAIALRSVLQNVLLATPREWIRWAGTHSYSDYVDWAGSRKFAREGPFGLLRTAPLLWDPALELPVRHVWVGLDGDSLPPVHHPLPDWETLDSLRNPTGHLTLTGFVLDPPPLKLTHPFALHLIPRRRTSTDDATQPPPTDMTEALSLHVVPPIVPRATALLSSNGLGRAWRWIASYRCMAQAYRTEGIRGPDAQAELKRRRAELMRMGMFALGRRGREERRFDDDWTEVLPYTSEGRNLLAQLDAIYEYGRGRSRPEEEGDNVPWIQRDGPVEQDGAEELYWDDSEEDEWDKYWGKDYGIPSVIESWADSFMPVNQPVLVHEVVLSEVELKHRILTTLFPVGSPLVSSVDLPLCSPPGAFAYLDFLADAHPTLRVLVRRVEPDGTVEHLERTKVSLPLTSPFCPILSLTEPTCSPPLPSSRARRTPWRLPNSVA